MATIERSFGPNSTTREVLSGIDLQGKTALITGASGGLGAETARALAAAGANVILTARDLIRGQSVAESIRGESPNVQVELQELELDSFASVRRSADAILAGTPSLDLLINNAGIMGCPLMRTSEGHEMQFGTCHLGHFLLTAKLIPALRRAPAARVINLSSAGHFLGGMDLEDPDFHAKPYDKWAAYGQAKTANILFSVGLEARFGREGIHSFAVHPGAIATDLGRHLDSADIELLMGGKDGKPLEFKTVDAGAATTCWGASAPELEGRGGSYLLDCRVASLSDEATEGVAAYAIDSQTAEALWELSESACDVQFA
ncbi:MAG: SDR family NAD(P)-dependent oxidoreductase [Candidatus Binatia bacterium]|nr:SDR family NAD(P)-dependent oxidoreductase [Candidatus Binatia bacterium]